MNTLLKPGSNIAALAPKENSRENSDHRKPSSCYGALILISNECMGTFLVTPKQRPVFPAPQLRRVTAQQQNIRLKPGQRSASTFATSLRGQDGNARIEQSRQTKHKMIDTIALKTSKTVNVARMEDLTSNHHHEWTTRSEELKLSRTCSTRISIRAHNKERKQTALIDNDRCLKRLECSAARRLYGTNGIQLKNEDEVHRARAALLHDTRYFIASLTEEELQVCRIDLALTLHVSPILLDLHRHATHPMVRREKELYNNHGKVVRTEDPMSSLQTVRFHGVNTIIQLYDKPNEVRQKKGEAQEERSHAVRVEVQLKGTKHIAKQFGWKEREFMTLADLELATCYRVFRDILLRFQNIARTPSFQPNTASFVAILENYPVTWRHLGGMEPLDWVRRSKGLSDKHFKELRREVSRLQLGLQSFHWADLLPEHRLPDLVDIDGNGVATFIPSPWSFA